MTGKVSDEHGPYRQRKRLDWVIAGGESGPGARPMNPDWARDLRDQCKMAGVPYFFKQWGGWKPQSPLNMPGALSTASARSAPDGCSTASSTTSFPRQ